MRAGLNVSRVARIGLILAAVAACSSPSATPAATCVGSPAAPDQACVLRVEGTVTDLAGAPVPKAGVSMCSRICYGAAAGADGRFSIPVGAWLRASDYALHVSGRPGFGDVYTKVAPPTAGAITLPSAIRLPPLPLSGPALPAAAGPAAQLTAGDVTFDLPAGVTFVLDVADLELGAPGRQLRAATVPLDAAPDFTRGIADVIALVALAPSGAVASAPLGVHLPNASGLSPGASLDVYVLDDDYRPLPPTAGAARLVAKAHVSADGRTLDTDEGQGISNLTWLVVARHP